MAAQRQRESTTKVGGVEVRKPTEVVTYALQVGGHHVQRLVQPDGEVPGILLNDLLCLVVQVEASSVRQASGRLCPADSRRSDWHSLTN